MQQGLGIITECNNDFLLHHLKKYWNMLKSCNVFEAPFTFKWTTLFWPYGLCAEKFNDLDIWSIILVTLFCQNLQAAFHTTSPRYSSIYVLHCACSPPPHRLLCLLPQGHVTSCDRRHQHGLTTLLGEHAGQCLAEYKYVRCYKDCF